MPARVWTADELPYNGEPKPLRKMHKMTPRQQDILSRVLNDVRYAMLRPARERMKPGDKTLDIRSTDLDALMFGPCAECGNVHNGIRMDLEEIKLFIEAIELINPRRD